MHLQAGEAQQVLLNIQSFIKALPTILHCVEYCASKECISKEL